MTGIGRYWKGLAVAAIAVSLLAGQLNADVAATGQTLEKKTGVVETGAVENATTLVTKSRTAELADGLIITPSAVAQKSSKALKGQPVDFGKVANPWVVQKTGAEYLQTGSKGLRDVGNVGDNDIDLYSAIDISNLFTFTGLPNNIYADDIVTIPYQVLGEAYAIDSFEIWYWPSFASDNGMLMTVYAYDDYSEVTDCDTNSPVVLSLTKLGQVLVNFGDDPDPVNDYIHRYEVSLVDGTVKYSDAVVNGSSIVWSTLGETGVANPMRSLPLGLGDSNATEEYDNQALIELQAGQIVGGNFVLGGGAEIVLSDAQPQFGTAAITLDYNENGTYECDESFFGATSYDYTSLPISLRGSRSIDCNVNGIADELELIMDPSLDDGTLCPGATQNGIIDECECLDCNNNGVDDITDINNGTSEDCNGDYVPDECQIEGNDCNSNGILDVCDIINGAPDCNQNNLPDECDLANGAANCDGNDVPDVCERYIHDCNLNGVDDYCDITNGDANDLNGDYVPDECLTLPNPIHTQNWKDITFEADQGYVDGPVDLQPADEPEWNSWDATTTNGIAYADVDPIACGAGNGLVFRNLLRTDPYNDFIVTPALTETEYDEDYDPSTPDTGWVYFDQPAYQEIKFDIQMDQEGGADPIIMLAQLRNLADDDDDWVGFVGIYPMYNPDTSDYEWFVSDADRYESTGLAVEYGVCFEVSVSLDLTQNGVIPGNIFDKQKFTNVGRINITRKSDSVVVLEDEPFTPARPLFTDIIFWNSENETAETDVTTTQIDNIVVIRKGSTHPNIDDCNGNNISDLIEIAESEAGTNGSVDCNKNMILDECEVEYCTDCDRNLVLDTCQIAEDPGMDVDGNGILDLCDGPVFNQQVPASISFEAPDFTLGNVDNQNGFWVNYLVNFTSGERMLDDAKEYEQPDLEDPILFNHWNVISKAGTPLANVADGNNVLYAEKNLTGDGGYSTQYVGTPAMLTPGNDEGWEQWTFTMAMDSAQTLTSGAGDYMGFFVTDFCNQDQAEVGVLIDGTAAGFHEATGRWQVQVLDDTTYEWLACLGINSSKTWTPNEPFQVRMVIERDRAAGARTVYKFRRANNGSFDGRTWLTCQQVNNTMLPETLDNHMRMVTRQINANQWYDDIQYYAATDCDGNGYPDVVDYNDYPNGDVDFTADPDTNADGISDLCQDCNNNLILDPIEIDGNPSLDCNGTGTLDSCDILDGTSTDCDGNSVPDECQFPLATGDCNGNGKIDACDISTNGSDPEVNHDSNGDGIHDECQDCNNNSVPDPLDLQGNSDDRDGNGIPDECCLSPNGADFDEDGDRDLYDYRRMQQCQGQVQGDSGDITNGFYRAECGCADLNDDGVVDGHDLKLFQLIYTGPPAN